MGSLGDIIRQLRESRKLPLRTVAAYLDIDQAMLSRIERGQRKATRAQVVKLAEYFKVKGDGLLIAWLSDKVFYEVADEKIALKALQAAEDKVEYNTFEKLNRKTLIQRIINILKAFRDIKKAWVFGSFSRGEEDYKSDIDLLIETDKNTKFSYFDLFEVQHRIENLTNRKIDIAFYDSVKPEPWQRIKNEIKLIYEK